MTTATAVKTIRIRYKQGALPGEASAFNDYSAPTDINGRTFNCLMYPGQEADIPGDLLDDREEFRYYRFPDKSEKMVTEKEYRSLLYKYGGYEKHDQWLNAAPMASTIKSIILDPRQMDQREQVQFLKKQREATLKYRYFDGRCMELISEEPGSALTKEDELKPVSSGPDILKMSQKDAIHYIKSIKDESLLSDISLILDRAKNANPVLFPLVEVQLKSIRNQ